MEYRWQDDAVCAQIGPHVFFLEDGGATESKMAKRICRTQCTVREQCLELGLSMPGGGGIFGGVGEKTRRKIRQQREREALAA